MYQNQKLRKQNGKNITGIMNNHGTIIQAPFPS